MLDVALLGTGGMVPLPHRWLSSVLLRWQSHLILFDCGEGTQITLRALGWGVKNLDLILISHLHGDHVSGLPGLLLSQGNAGRTAPVRIVGPPGLEAVVAGLCVVAPHLPFKLKCHEVDGPGPLSPEVTFEGLVGACTLADHSVPCLAYRLDVPRQPRFQPEHARALGVPMQQWKTLAQGQTAQVTGRTVRPGEVLGPPRAGMAVGLVTDTRPTAEIETLARGVDLLICEGTYGSSDDAPKAAERKHMTFAEAATLAKRAGVRQLVLTHFSPALAHPEEYAANAQTIFPNTIVGADHLTLSLTFDRDE
ncbi:MAG TPA: ribonuclease Z [Chloroflexota bacterium]|nr:ribonuclease Z [Chloroflexota bacterium]